MAAREETKKTRQRPRVPGVIEVWLSGREIDEDPGSVLFSLFESGLGLPWSAISVAEEVDDVCSLGTSSALSLVAALATLELSGKLQPSGHRGRWSLLRFPFARCERTLCLQLSTWATQHQAPGEDLVDILLEALTALLCCRKNTPSSNGPALDPIDEEGEFCGSNFPQLDILDALHPFVVGVGSTAASALQTISSLDLCFEGTDAFGNYLDRFVGLGLSGAVGAVLLNSLEDFLDSSRRDFHLGMRNSLSPCDCFDELLSEIAGPAAEILVRLLQGLQERSSADAFECALRDIGSTSKASALIEIRAHLKDCYVFHSEFAWNFNYLVAMLCALEPDLLHLDDDAERDGFFASYIGDGAKELFSSQVFESSAAFIPADAMEGQRGPSVRSVCDGLPSSLSEAMSRAISLPEGFRVCAGTNLLRAAHSLQISAPQQEGTFIVGRDIRIVRTLPSSNDDWQDGLIVGLSEVEEALSRGYTVVLRSAHLRNPALARLVHKVEQDVGLVAGGNLYVTPAPGHDDVFRQGLPPHIDDHDVFVVQIEGEKTWSLGTSSDTPIIQMDRSDIVAGEGLERRSLEECAPLPRFKGGKIFSSAGPMLDSASSLQPSARNMKLCAGSCLYVPRGMLHKAQNSTQGSHSVHLSVALEADEAFTWLGAIRLLLLITSESHADLANESDQYDPEFHSIAMEEQLFLTAICEDSEILSDSIGRVSIGGTEASFIRDLNVAVGAICKCIHSKGHDSLTCYKPLIRHDDESMLWVRDVDLHGPPDFVAWHPKLVTTTVRFTALSPQVAVQFAARLENACHSSSHCENVRKWQNSLSLETIKVHSQVSAMMLMASGP